MGWLGFGKPQLRGKNMASIYWEIEELRNKGWNKEKYRDVHHEDFLFIKETELLTRDEHVENIDRLINEGQFNSFTQKSKLVHENEFVLETRWQDDNEIVTRVYMLKDGKAWRLVVSRIPIREAA